MSAPAPSPSSASSAPDSIFLLQGKGVEKSYFDKTEQSFKHFLGKESGRLITIDASYVIRDLKKFGKNLSIPGGNAFQLGTSLTQAGLDAIRDFVDEGRSFIGFCAPCYLVGPSKFCCSEKGALELNYGLNLSRYSLFGPAVKLGGEGMVSNHTGRAVSVRYGDCLQKTCDVFWNGGGAYFYVDSYASVELVRYEEPETRRIAAYCAYGRGGSTVLCNVHPEVQLDEEEALVWCPGITPERRAALVAGKPAQQEMFAELCRYAQLKIELTPPPKQKESPQKSVSDGAAAS